MKIALLHYSVPPVVGGVESVLAHHARLMTAAGHDVRVVAARGARFDPQVDFISIPLVDSRHADILAVKAELDAGRVPSQFEALVQNIKQSLKDALVGVDVAIAHNICSLHKNLALTSALRNLVDRPGAPRLILWHHDLAWTTPRYRAELYDGYPWDLLRTAWPDVVQVVVSELRRDELAELFGISIENVFVVPNGLDAEVFLKLEPQTRDLIDRLDLLNAGPLLLLPVRITTRKNIELALHILAKLRSRYPDAMLVVTGPPGPHNPANVEYFSRLKAIRDELRLEKVAHFLAEVVDAYLPDEVIADFYRLADLLILPSREEGFGIPVIEAGLVRMPVFCTDIPPLQALGGEEAHYFSPDAEPGVVAEHIARHLDNDDTYRLGLRVRRSYIWQGVYTERIAPLLEKGR
ncbi:MAG: glycosyltransferase [Anaerolineae bacterium]|nr:glycosyltransferase [Anaerolineae bacterium]